MKQSILNQENLQQQQQHHHQLHPSPSSTSPSSKKSSTSTLEPIYANVSHVASGDAESDTISELDSKEKRGGGGGRLSKFLRKHKT